MNDINVLKNNGVDLDSSLEFLGDMEMYDETLNEFLNSISEKVNNLKSYKEANDMPNYAICVHSLKSDARYLGFVNLGNMAYQHEMESKAANAEFVNTHFAELINEVARTINIAKAYLVNNPAPASSTAPVAPATPAVPATPVAPVAQTAPAAPAKDAILVVDDSDMVRNFISKIFKNEFDCLLASDGQKAIEILSADNNIKGVLLDLNMPKVNGFEVLDFLKNNNLFVKYPVSIITGADDKETITRAFTYQIIDMLQKPFNEKDVKRIIERTLNYGRR